MRLSARRSRALSFIASCLAVAGVATWAAAQTAAPSEAVTVLAGFAGVIVFSASLAPALARGRHRTMATGLVLVAVAVVVAATKQAPGTRTGFVVVSGAVLFCAAETADRVASRARRAERRPGVDRSGLAWVLAVALGAGAVSYGCVSARDALAGGGPAGLAAGTAAAILVAALAAMTLRARGRRGT